MGAGGFPAGAGPAGSDPVADPSAEPTKRPAGAIRFDLETSSFKIESDGNYAVCHWVDQWVQLQLNIRYGTLAADPTRGHQLMEIPRANKTRTAAIYRDFVKLALKEGTDAKWIRIDSIEVDTEVSGRTFGAVNYVNLIEQFEKAQQQNPKVKTERIRL